jgi:hypothetical protein
VLAGLLLRLRLLLEVPGPKGICSRSCCKMASDTHNTVLYSQWYLHPLLHTPTHSLVELLTVQHPARIHLHP